MPDNEVILKRRLGKTGADVSIIGLGGSHIGFDNITDDEAIRIMRKAIDEGITFFDNNWGYHNGRSEERMGEALQDGYRDKVFLMTKTDALKQLVESLKRLKTDYVDLWQIHEIIYENDPDLISRPGGVLEALDEAKRSGKIRFAGFTGHKDPALHLRTLDLYPFDTVQMPVNVMDAHFRSFQKEVLPVLVERDIGVIAMKSFGDPHVLKSGLVTPEEALRYVLTMPVSTVVTGIDSMDVLDQNIQIARNFQPMSGAEIEDILARTALLDVSGNGRYELYKTSKQYDADPGRIVHGFPTMEEVAM